MAIKETIQVDVQTNLAQEEKHATGIRTQLEAAGRVRMSNPKMAAATGPEGTASATNLSRGIGGQTGASGRDFAAQAQGLGGLVHVYATFAANIFAVTTAFTALSKAADTTNLIKGLDQLGASSGRALGGVAKQMAMVSDGALSLRDAMSSAALASSAGMNNANMLRMTEVARKASQALGRDMADSMDRLTKGIAKTQPELLDELGIMARVIPAQEAYARQIGKTVSSLTDLEKKQAFANAVLEEGEKKFSAIKIDANPYSQLSATLINVLQSSLEFINKGLGPIAGILASSPTALTAALATLGVVLLKQALPALGQFKQGLQASADLATDLANKRSKAANAARQADFVALRQALENEAEVKTAALDKAEANARKIAAASNLKPGSAIKNILNKDVREIDQTDFTKIETEAKKAETRKGGNEALAASYRNIAQAVRESQAAEAAYDKQIAEGTKRLQERQGVSTAVGRAQILADRANLAATTRSIASQAAETASISGFGPAMSEARKSIDNARKGIKEIITETGQIATTTIPAMGAVRASWSLFTAGVAAGTTAISTFMSVAAPWLMVIGLVVTAFSFLAGVLSKNAKAAAETQTAFDQLDEATKTTVNVFERLQGLDPLERLSTQNISAKSTAITETAASIENAFKKITKQVDEANWWDKLVDKGAALVGLGLIKQSSTELANATSESLRLAKGTAAGAKAAEELSKALNIDATDKEALKSALGDSQEKFFKLAPQVVAITKTLGTELTKTSMAAQNFDAAVATASKTFDDLLISMLPTDITAKIGFDFINLGKTIGDALASPEQAMQKLADVAKDNQKLRLFSPEFAAEIAKASPMIQETSERLAKYQQGIKDQQEEVGKLLKQREALASVKDKFGLAKNTTALQQAGASINTLQTLSKPLEQELAPFIEKFRNEEIKAFTRGAEIVQASIGDGFAKAAVTVSKAYAEGLGGTIGGIQERARLEKESIQIQIRQLESASNLAKSQDNLALITEERLLFDKAAALKAGPQTTDTAQQLKIVEAQQRGLEIAKSLLGKANTTQAINLMKSGTEEGRAAGKFVLPSVQRTEATSAKVAESKAQKQAVDIGAEFQKMQQISAIEKDRLATLESGLTVEKATIDVRAKNALYLDNELLALKQQNEEAIAANKIAQENLSYQLEIDKAIKSYTAAKSGSKEEANALKAIQELGQKYANAQQRQQDDAAKRAIGYTQDALAAEKARFDLTISNSKSIEADRQAAAQAELTVADEKLARLTAAGALEQSEIVGLTTKSNIAKETERSYAAQYATAIAFTQQQAALQEKLDAQPDKGSAAAANIQAQMALQQASFTSAIAREQELTAEKTKTLTVQGQINEMLAKQAEVMDKMKNLTQSLTTVFGEMGAVIGKSAETFMKFAQDQENFEAARKTAVAQYGKDSEQVKKLETKNKEEQIKGISGIAAASKKMFSERTVGYKLLNTVEKASAAVSLAIQAKALAAKAIDAAKSIGIDIPVIYAKFMAQLGPVGIGVATAAIVALLGSSAGGGGPKSYSGPSAEDQQKVQGTGMQYQQEGDKYKLVDSGFGVLGASDQLSDTLTKTQTLLAENSVKGLEVDKSMLKAINNLVSAIGSAVTTIALNGDISRGLNFGTLPGQKTTPDFLGTKNGLNAGIGAGIGSLFGPLGAIGGAIIGGLANSIFGGSTSATSSIAGAGLKFSGTIDELAKGTAGALNQYKDVLIQFSKDGGWFGKDKNWTEMREQLLGVNDELTDAIGLVFMGVSDVAYAVAKKAGVASNTVDEALKSVRVTDKLNLQGLSLEDQNALLQSVSSKSLTQVFEKLVPQYKKYKVSGEDYAATVFRVLDAQDKVNLSLDLVGSKFTHNLGVDFTQTLIKAAGGLKNFVDQANFFAEKFNTEAENTALAQEQLTKGMKGLGFSSVTTREQFKQLVKGINKDLNPANAELYQRLMEIAPAFDQVASAAEKAAATTYDLQTSLLTAQGFSSKAQDRTRQKTVDGLASESDKVLQRKIYAQEDLNKTNSLNIELLNAENKSYEALKLTREQELKALTDIDAAIKKKVYAEQDAAKTQGLVIQLLNLQGKTEDALTLTRERELLALSTTDQAIQRQIYALQDQAAAATKLNTIRSSEIAIYNLLNKNAEALALQREQDLESTADYLKASKRYQFALENEKTIKDKIATAYTKQKDALKSTITSLDGSIKSLKEFRSSLLTGANTVLTPSQIYQQNKNSFDVLAATATMAITDSSSDADKQAREDALSKLPQAATALLDSSRTMFASGDQYAADFSQVSTILDKTVGSLENQKSTAEYQLVALEDSVSFLNLIETNTETTTQLLAQLVALAPATEAARKAAAESGSIAAGGTGFTPQVVIGLTDVVEAVINSARTTSKAVQTASEIAASDTMITNIILDKLVSILSQDRVIAVTVTPNIILNSATTTAAAAATPTAGAASSKRPDTGGAIAGALIGNILLPGIGGALIGGALGSINKGAKKLGKWLGFAEGGLAPAGINLVGEKGPELVDFKTPGRVYSNRASNDLFNSKQLVEEIRSLRQEVNRLRNDQKEQTGHLITATYDANAQNAEQVTAGTEDALQAQNWKTRSQIKFA
jgi:hypothetical protein